MVLITTMDKLDSLGIDGHQLKILLAIYECGSLSGAARALDINQSTVSYHLANLRERLGDELFVRSGSGVEPTERAKYMRPMVEGVVHQLIKLGEAESYDPTLDQSVLRIAATGVERDLVTLPLLEFARERAPRLQIKIVQTGSLHEAVEMLKTARVDLLFFPELDMEVDGIVQRLLLTFADAVFFDRQHPLQENDLKAFSDRPHARVSLGPDASYAVDKKLAEEDLERSVVFEAPDFISVLKVIPGTDIVSTLPSLLLNTADENLACVPPPWPDQPKKLMMYWQSMQHSSARHSFWREQIVKIANASTERPPKPNPQQ
ncbi:MAG: LysR family transcriptional regulator [Pseudomonadota bacterium]